jgi:uncharacterized protein YlxW (UPF0749 family)
MTASASPTVGGHRWRPWGTRRPVLTTSRLLVVAVTMVGGFATVAQFRGTARARATLQGDSPEDLTRILASLNTGADALRDEISNLKIQLLSIQNSAQQNDAARRAAEDRLRSLEVLAGTVPVFGPGVEARVDDPRDAVTYDLLISTVEELRDAGAESVAIDGHRLGASSWLGADGNQLTADGEALSTPYVIDAIGDPATLDSGLRIPGGAIDSLTALAGVTVDVHRQARLDLAALPRVPAFGTARPVGSSP